MRAANIELRGTGSKTASIILVLQMRRRHVKIAICFTQNGKHWKKSRSTLNGSANHLPAPATKPQQQDNDMKHQLIEALHGLIIFAAVVMFWVIA